MRLAMGRSGRIQRLPLLLLLVVLISAGVSGKPQQGAGGGEESPEGDYADNYDEYNPVDYEPEYEEGTSIFCTTPPPFQFVRSTPFNHWKMVESGGNIFEPKIICNAIAKGKGSSPPAIVY